jgi:putative membrane protein
MKGARVAMRVERFFTASDLQAIEAAVHEAEKGTSGEIVPCAVAHSDHYEAAAWKGAVLGAFAAVVVAAAARYFGDFWGFPALGWIVLPPLIGGALGYAAAAMVRPLKLALAGRAHVEHRVHQRAAEAFLENEVFKTRERTGVLIFLSLYERRVVVLGDAGINAHIGQHEWDAVVAGIAAGMRAGKPGQALGAAIARCGELLERRGVAIRADDTDELPDTLRMQEE